MAGLVERLDAQLDDLFKGWNIITSILLLLLLVYLIYPLVTSEDPDTHPLLLSRQANVSAVRQEGESAIYRSLEVPHGYPLKTGLNVKDPAAAKWAGGKDGDLRDVWRRAAGFTANDGGEVGSQIGRILTVLGRENIVEHDMASVSKQINVIGRYIKEQGCTAVAIYLPNSVELLTTIFAGAFYGFTPILIPYNQPSNVVMKLLQLTKADFLVAAAGSLPSTDIREQCKGVRKVMWVVEPSSRDMDWKDSANRESVWHELLEESADGTSELPPNSTEASVAGITTVWLDESPEHGEIVTFTQSNIVAAVAAQLSALPSRHRITPADLFLPADSLTAIYILVQTLAALFSNASIAINSVAGPDVELPLAAIGIAPTIIAASAESASKLHTATASKINGRAKKFALRSQSQALQAGYMPRSTLLSRVNIPTVTTVGSLPGKLRLIYVFERTHAGTPPLSSTELSDLRAFTGARVIYALTTAKVAGTVTQTHFFDYRVEDVEERKHAHFGVPTSSLEIKVMDKGEYQTVGDGTPRGELVVNGPAVLGGEANLGVLGTFRDDGTLAYLEV